MTEEVEMGPGVAVSLGTDTDLTLKWCRRESEHRRITQYNQTYNS